MKKTATSHDNYFLFTIVVLVLWFSYMSYTKSWHLFEECWEMTLTMVFGSIVAGGSSEGGGAIAFPVMTLLLDTKPALARNFGLAIQSIGMLAASIYIVSRKITVDWTAIKYGSLGSFVGFVFGAFFLVPFMEPTLTKLLFVTIWLTFGVYLFRVRKRETLELSDYKKLDLLRLILFGILGGLVTSIFGNGIDIVIFGLLTLYFKLSEKIATPTSVVLMTLSAIFGSFVHIFVLQDFQTEAFNYWLVCVPVVIFGAPLGAWFVNRLNRKLIVLLLTSIVCVQFVGAVLVISPTVEQFGLMICTFIGAAYFFRLMLKSPH